MENKVFQRIYISLLDTAKGKDNWVRVYEGEIPNSVARAYYDSNYSNIDSVYVDFIDSKVIILLKEGAPIFFWNENGEKFYQIKTLKDIEGYMFLVLIKIIQRDQRICELESEVSDLEDMGKIYRNDDTIMYKVLYEECLEEIENLKRILENKTIAYERLNTQYEKLIEKCNWDID